MHNRFEQTFIAAKYQMKLPEVFAIFAKRCDKQDDNASKDEKGKN